MKNASLQRATTNGESENAVHLSLIDYLTAQIREIIGLGPNHALIWALKSQWRHWLQVSVHDGAQRYLTVQFPLPRGVSKRRLDRLFGSCGWRQMQADRTDSLLYYVARSASQERLFAQAEAVARQCAETMRLLWNVEEVEQVALLAARGPRLPLIAVTRTPAGALPRAA